MRRFLIAIAAVVCLSALGWGRVRQSGWCEQGAQTVTINAQNATPKFQRGYASATVSVFDTGTTNLSTIYSDNIGTVKSNPFTADSTGAWFFYADNARYDVQCVSGGTTLSYGDFSLLDPVTFLSGNQTIGGVWTFSGNNIFSGANTFSGGNTFSGTNTFSGVNTFSGANLLTAQRLNGVRFADQIGSGDNFSRIGSAITDCAGPCWANAFNFAAQSPAASLNISQQNVTSYFGNYTTTMGTHQITAPVGTYGLFFKGVGPWAGTGSGGGAAGSWFTYTGTGAGIKIGDNTNQTFHTRIADLGLDLTGAGASAIGVQLNSTVFSDLDRLRISLANVSSQIGINIVGNTVSSQYSAFNLIKEPYVTGGLIGLQHGGQITGVNSNQIIGGLFTGPGSGVASSIGIDLEHGGQNFIFGTDIENYQTGIVAKEDASVFGFARIENVTTHLNFGATGCHNFLIVDNTAPVVTDSCSDGSNTVLSPSRWVFRWNGDARFRSDRDEDRFWDFVPGVASGAGRNFVFRFFSLTTGAPVEKFQIRKSAGETLDLWDSTNSIVRFQVNGDTTELQSHGTSAVRINMQAGTSGTGGLIIGSAGTQKASIDGNGILTVLGVAADSGGIKHKRGTAGCATAASAGATCTTTVTWTTTFPDTNYTVSCSGDGITSGVPVLEGIATKIAASVTLQTAAITAAAAQFTNIECIAIHD